MLQQLYELCANGWLLVTIYVNYDCDCAAVCVFVPMMNALARIVQSTEEEAGWSTLQEAQSLRAHALRALAAAACSLAGVLREEGANARHGMHEHAHSEPCIERTREQKKALADAVVLFNAKPSKGVQAVIAAGVIDSTADAVGMWLRYTVGLSRKMVGEYLGGEDSFVQSALRSFISTLDVANVDLDTALRRFFLAFHLPAEGQKIERILQTFSQRFVELNSDAFADADAAFVVTVAIVMLNTDLHNPQVRSCVRELFLIARRAGEAEDVNGCLHFTAPRSERGQRFPSRVPRRCLSTHRDDTI